MKTLLAFSTAVLLVGAMAAPQAASADTASATCEVRKDGDKQKGKSGPCTFGQRQGYIDIDLKNGETVSLSPAGNANHYKDGNGNKVVRTSSTASTQEFKWEGGKKLTVRFVAASTPSTAGVNDLADMVNGRWVGAEVKEEIVRRGYKHVRDNVAGEYVTSFYKGHGKCVIVNLDTDKRVTSVDNGPGC